MAPSPTVSGLWVPGSATGGSPGIGCRRGTRGPCRYRQKQNKTIVATAVASGCTVSWIEVSVGRPISVERRAIIEDSLRRDKENGLDPSSRSGPPLGCGERTMELRHGKAHERGPLRPEHAESRAIRGGSQRGRVV